jgi:hypothetical protein
VEPLYYTTRFMDGLKDEIKFVVVVQRPKYLDASCCLALLHEESTAPTTKSVKSFEAGFCDILLLSKDG